jgi:MYXO-CTERM domain-containing protein
MKIARTLAALAVVTTLAAPAAAEPTDPVVIGWWSYFTPEGAAYQVPTNDPAHPISMYGDPNVYFYEPSGGNGLQGTQPADQAWQSILNWTFAHSDNATLSPDFTIDTSSDLQTLQYAYFGWAVVLLYVPKDKYCDSYRIHVGSVDDGMQAMANSKILGYAKLGDSNVYIDMVEYNTNNLVLRPGINEVALIHADQAKVQRYIHDVWIEHDGVQIPLAPKNIIYGQVTDQASMKPIYQATVDISGNGLTDTFSTGPFGYYFFDTLADGTYQLSADAAGYVSGMGSGAVAMGVGSTEVVRTDLALTQGCSCPGGKMCGPSGGCLDPCVLQGEEQETCTDPAATCVNHVCVKDPCDTLTCAPGFYCQAGTAGNPPVPVGNCVELACSNVCCGAGQVCSAGACVTDNCAAGCATGQVCASGNCVDACSVITCVTPLVCQAGVCVDPCVANPGSCDTFDGGFGAGGGTTGTTGSGAASGSSNGGAGGMGAGGESGSGASAGTGASGGTGTKSGCGCRVAGEEENEAGLGLVLALAGVLSARRRRG